MHANLTSPLGKLQQLNPPDKKLAEANLLLWRLI